MFNLLRGFDQRANATGAQCLANHSSVLVHRDFLKVGLELSLGRSHRVASIVPEGGLFSTLFTDRHAVILSQLYDIITGFGYSTSKQQIILPYSMKSDKQVR